MLKLICIAIIIAWIAVWAAFLALGLFITAQWFWENVR
jgi:hypothetical protein